MARQIKYITQLTADDIAKMMAAGDLTAGRGIKVGMVGDKLQVSLDTDVIVDIIWCFVRQGMVHEGLSGAPCTVPYTAKDTRNHVLTDPNQFT